MGTLSSGVVCTATTQSRKLEKVTQGGKQGAPSLDPVSLLHPVPVSPAQPLVFSVEPWDSKGLGLEKAALGELVLGTYFILDTDGALQSHMFPVAGTCQFLGVGTGRCRGY